MFNQKQMLSQLKKMQEEMVKVQEDLRQEKIEGFSGEKKVCVTINGHMEIQSVKIDPGLLNPDDAEILEDLIVVAFREASEKARELSTKKLSPFTGGMRIPGL